MAAPHHPVEHTSVICCGPGYKPAYPYIAAPEPVHHHDHPSQYHDHDGAPVLISVESTVARLHSTAPNGTRWHNYYEQTQNQQHDRVNNTSTALDQFLLSSSNVYRHNQHNEQPSPNGYVSTSVDARNVFASTQIDGIDRSLDQSDHGDLSSAGHGLLHSSDYAYRMLPENERDDYYDEHYLQQQYTRAERVNQYLRSTTVDQLFPASNAQPSYGNHHPIQHQLISSSFTDSQRWSHYDNQQYPHTLHQQQNRHGDPQQQQQQQHSVDQQLRERRAVEDIGTETIIKRQHQPQKSRRGRSVKPNAQTDKAEHMCQICNKSYCRKSTLKSHIRQHNGDRPFSCKLCGKTFSQAANLTAHRRVHTGEKPFSCTICLRPFSQSSSLVTHRRTHTGERPYRCEHCHKAFTDSSTLTKHMRTHTGDKPYGCSMCLMRFTQSGNLHRHLKTHATDANVNDSPEP